MRNPKHSRGGWCWCPNVRCSKSEVSVSLKFALFSLVFGSVSIYLRLYTRSICKVYFTVVVVFIVASGIRWPSFVEGKQCFFSPLWCLFTVFQ